MGNTMCWEGGVWEHHVYICINTEIPVCVHVGVCVILMFTCLLVFIAISLFTPALAEHS